MSVPGSDLVSACLPSIQEVTLYHRHEKQGIEEYNEVEIVEGFGPHSRKKLVDPETGERYTGHLQDWEMRTGMSPDNGFDYVEPVTLDRQDGNEDVLRVAGSANPVDVELEALVGISDGESYLASGFYMDMDETEDLTVDGERDVVEILDG